MHTLKDRVAIVTGSSRGVGKAIAVCFGGAECKIVVNYKTSGDKAQGVTREIEKSGGESIVVKADVTNEKDEKNMISETLQAFGEIDILVNNVGAYLRCGFFSSSMFRIRKIPETGKFSILPLL